MSDKTLAPVDDPIAGPYFVNLGEGRFTCQRCDSCQAYRWPPLPTCPECHSKAHTWAEVAPTGTIWSYVTYHRAFQPSLKDQIPYTVAMVQLDESPSGPYMVGRLIDGEKPPTVGDRVNAEIVDDDGVPSVRWRIA